MTPWQGLRFLLTEAKHILWDHAEVLSSQARFQMRVFCILRVEKQAIGHSPLFSHSLTRNTCNIPGFNLQGTVLPSSEVYKEAGTDNITQCPLELVPVLHYTVLHLLLPQDFLSSRIGIKREKLPLNKISLKCLITLKIMIKEWTDFTFCIWMFGWKTEQNPCILVKHFDFVKCTLSHWKIFQLDDFQVAFLPTCFSIQFKLQLLVVVVHCCSECWHLCFPSTQQTLPGNLSVA